MSAALLSTTCRCLHSQPGGAASAKTWSLTHRVSERPRVPWHPISRRSGAPRERAFPALCHRPTGARCGVCRVLTLSLVHVKGSCRRSLHAGQGTVPCTGIGCQRRGLRRRHGLPSQARNERKFDSPRGCRKSLGGSPRGSRYKKPRPSGSRRRHCKTALGVPREGYDHRLRRCRHSVVTPCRGVRVRFGRACGRGAPHGHAGNQCRARSG
jgi:hypothetical protein